MTSAALPEPRSAGPLRDLVFISYSHRDEDWRARLLIFLEAYADLKVWADPYIRVGDQWRREIATALARCSVAVLLVSPDFLVSDFIKREELPPLLRSADGGIVTLVPVPVSASNY